MVNEWNSSDVTGLCFFLLLPSPVNSPRRLVTHKNTFIVVAAAIEVDDDGKQRQSEILISHSCAVALLCLCGWYQNQFSLFSIIRHRLRLTRQAKTLKISLWNWTLRWLKQFSIDARTKRRLFRFVLFVVKLCGKRPCSLLASKESVEKSLPIHQRLLRVDDRFVASSCAQPQTTISERFF